MAQPPGGVGLQEKDCPKGMKYMRIGYDGRSFASEQRTGIGQYAVHLLESLRGCAASHDLRVFVPSHRGRTGPNPVEIRTVRTIVPSDIREDRFYRLWLDLYLPMRVRFDRIDLFHGPSYVVPKSRRARTVVTIHDLAHERNPEWGQGCSPEFSKRVMQSVVSADAVIAVSHTTKKDVVDIYPVNPEKVTVIYEGVDSGYRSIDNRDLLEGFRKRYGLPERFVLSVSSLHPRKNIGGLLRCFSMLKKETGLPHSLVITGKDYGGFDLAGEVERMGLADRFLFLHYVPSEELPMLYNAAEIFVFPSFYEGFGLPPLEAMACGVPVAASRAGSLPEVLGDAALYFDPRDPQDMAARLAEMLRSESERERMRERGMRRAKGYRWSECARKTLSLYEKLV
jgi:glycosyltransferase involved in cell wall biosynthesis